MGVSLACSLGTGALVLVHVVLRDTYWDSGEGSPTLHSVAVAIGAVHPVCM